MLLLISRTLKSLIYNSGLQSGDGFAFYRTLSKTHGYCIAHQCNWGGVCSWDSRGKGRSGWLSHTEQGYLPHGRLAWLKWRHWSCGVWLSLPEYAHGKQLEAVRKLLLLLSSTSWDAHWLSTGATVRHECPQSVERRRRFTPADSCFAWVICLPWFCSNINRSFGKQVLWRVLVFLVYERWIPLQGIPN